MSDKVCKSCNHNYSLRLEGRYCPACGRDYWNGLCGSTKVLNKEELRLNNDKFKKMKKTTIVLLFMMVFADVSAQVYWDEILEADTSGYILMSDVEGVFDTVPLLLEGRNDSICIVGGECIGIIPVGLQSYSIEYNETTKGFDITSVTDGIPLVQFIPYEVRNTQVVNDTILNLFTNITGIVITTDKAEAYEPEDLETYNIPIDNSLFVRSINDTTNRIYIYRTDQLIIGDPPNSMLHDSADIVTPVQEGDGYEPNTDNQTLSIDSAGRVFNITLEDGGNVKFKDIDTDTQLSDVDILAFGYIKSFTETDPLFTLWDKSYLDLIDVPTYQDINYWTLTGVNELYYNNNVGIFNTNPARPLDVDGKISFNFGTKNVVIEGGNSLTGAENIIVGFNALNNATSADQNSIFGVQAGQSHTTGNKNSFMGYRAGLASSTGYENSFFGFNVGYYVGGGYRNTAIGSDAYKNAAGYNSNVAIGYQSMFDSNGNSNLAMGARSLFNVNGDYNTGLGYDSGYNMGTGDFNLFLGSNSGRSANGSYNVFIGNQAGANATGSNILHIHSSNAYTSTPLIWGDFDNRKLEINGDIEGTGSMKVGDLTDAPIYADGSGELKEMTVNGATFSGGALTINEPGQSLGAVNVFDAEYTSFDYPSYNLMSLTTEIHDDGDVNVDEVTLEAIQIDADGGGYYNIFVSGEIDCDSGETDNVIEYFYKIGATYYWIGTVTVKDTDNERFLIQSSALLSNSSNLVLAIKSPTSAAAGVNISNVKWEVIKI